MASLFSRSKSWLLGVFLFLCFLIVGRIVQVNGDSMVPSLVENQLAFVLCRSDIQRFDVIVIADQKNPKKRVIKRVIGLPGDELSYKDDQLFINNKRVKEPFLKEIKAALGQGSLLTENIEKIKIPKDSYFVLGDNRKISLDSRLTGAIHEDDIVGEAKFILWPPQTID